MVTRFYYGERRGYESSLDVYTPSEPLPGGAAPPLVVLVVGSAWLGHRACIYLPTSWWNSAGPQTIASLGAVCVAIRHRGAFVQAPPVEAAALLAAVLFALAGPAYALGSFLIWVALVILAHGAVTHEEMLEDVASALKWVEDNRSTLVVPGSPPPKVRIFGGYSSGGHCAASLLQRPDMLKAWGLPVPAAGYDGILMLSGVLGTRSEPPLPASSLSARLGAAVVKRLVFGRDGAEALPSPVHTAELTPAVPHLLLHCEHEVFALPVLESALSHLLCSTTYAAALRARGVPVVIRSVPSDHWFVLGSAELREALRAVLIDAEWPREQVKSETHSQDVS